MTENSKLDSAFLIQNAKCGLPRFCFAKSRNDGFFRARFCEFIFFARFAESQIFARVAESNEKNQKTQNLK
ncbi:hypothetical protein [Helicobacter sp. 23-1045]